MSQQELSSIVSFEDNESKALFADREESFKYDAFISYRHVEPDVSVAGSLHKLIETYKVPKSFL